MTCIVGLVDKGKIYMGADSAGVAGYSLTVRADKKIFKNGPFIMGFTSSFRMGQLLQYSFNPPKRHSDTDVMKYMVTDFIDSVRDCFKNGGFAEKDKEQESGGTFLVGYEERLFQIHSDYQVGESLKPYDACGCGSKTALGSLASTPGQDPFKRLKLALEVAESYSAGVRSPFYYMDN